MRFVLFRKTESVMFSKVCSRRLQRATKLIIIALFVSLIFQFMFSLPSSLRYLNASSSSNDISPRLASGLDVFIWRELCGSNVTYVHKSPFFPHSPDEKKIIADFQTDDNDTFYGQQILGFLHPSQSGFFRFGIASDDSSELWLSDGDDPKRKRLIARVYARDSSAWTSKGDLRKYPDQISGKVELSAEKKYFVEVLHKQGIGLGFVQVYWADPSPHAEFAIVGSDHLSPFSAVNMVPSKDKSLESIHVSSKDVEKSDGVVAENNLLKFFSLPRLPRKQYLPSCLYNSSFVVREKINHFDGVKLMYGRESMVFPEDDTSMASSSKHAWSTANPVADEKRIHSVVDKIISSVKRKTSKKFFLRRIHKVLQKSDPVYGDRFCVDLELVLQDNTNQSYRFSEHVYLPKGSESLCFPDGLAWNSSSTIYFILPVINQGKWVRHFIRQLSRASSLTGDTNFHVVVIDFHSKDIDMAQAFNTSLLSTRHTLVNLTGKFYKTLALNTGVDLVPSSHDIVFLFDLHIDLPADLLDSVRKNTIEGRIAFFPAVGRLDCESSSDEHQGFWQLNGYGLLAVYKSDWMRFGGMDTERYKYKWGGEDWDLLDRVLNAQLEVERIKYPGLYHHYHAKRNQWN